MSAVSFFIFLEWVIAFLDFNVAWGSLDSNTCATAPAASPPLPPLPPRPRTTLPIMAPMWDARDRPRGAGRNITF